MIEKLYKRLSERSAPALKFYLGQRVKIGKEDGDRLEERYGKASIPRPKEKLIWIHAASVGEAQVALILISHISKILATKPFFLVTTGTRTSATLMDERLPENAIHQYAVLDHPDWVRFFFDHWSPDIAFWMESELWPNTLKFLKKRHIPSALINARMSEKSFKNWSRIKKTAKSVLSCFDTILCQTEVHKTYFDQLGAHHSLVTDNLKYSAPPLPYDLPTLEQLKTVTKNRPLWLYASTHAGEEELACETHLKLKEECPNLLTIIVPRHPERQEEILKKCRDFPVSIECRTNQEMPSTFCDVYLADTLGELGLFYALCDIAVIGRSFSADGGGGHNPIEATLLDCAVLTGPHTQNQDMLFEGMIDAQAAHRISKKEDLATHIQTLLNNETKRQSLIHAGRSYASQKAGIITHILEEIEPLFLKADMPYR